MRDETKRITVSGNPRLRAMAAKVATLTRNEYWPKLSGPRARTRIRLRANDAITSAIRDTWAQPAPAATRRASSSGRGSGISVSSATVLPPSGGARGGPAHGRTSQAGKQQLVLVGNAIPGVRLRAAARALAHALDQLRVAKDRFDGARQLSFRVAEHDRRISCHLGIALGPARDDAVAVCQLLDQHRMGAAHLGAEEIGKGVRAQLVVGGAELVPGEDHAGRSDPAKLPLVVLAIGRIADDDEGKRRGDPGIGGDQMVQAVFGDESADRQEIATRLEAESPKSLRAECGRHLGAVRDERRWRPVFALVIGGDRVRIGDDRIAQPGSGAFRPAKVAASQPAPLASRPIRPIDVD